MTSYLLLALLLFLGLLRYGLGKGTWRLEALSRERRKTLEAIARPLHPAERQALTASSGLAFAADSGVLHLEGRLELIGWRQPMFVLDALLVAVPEQLLPCALTYNQAQLLLNPHLGLPHAFVVALNGVSLVCECEARRAGIEQSPARHVSDGGSFHAALPQPAPRFVRRTG